MVGLGEWPATRAALRRHRRALRRYLVLLTTGTGFQAVVLALSGWLRGDSGTQEYAAFLLSDLACMLPAYIGAWVIPPIVAANVAWQRSSGHWEALAVTRVRDADLWLSLVFAPAFPWFVLATAFCWPYLQRVPDGALAAAALLNPTAAPVLRDIAWGYPACSLLSGLTFAELGAICGFRVRTIRGALVLTLTLVVGSGYAGVALSLLSSSVPGWWWMPLLLYGSIYEPAALLAPNWMLGASIYTIPSTLVERWIVWIAAGVYTLLALVLGATSFQTMRCARRPQR